MKDKKGETVLNDFIETVNESNRKPSNLWVGQGDNFTINLCKNGYSNSISMVSTYNEGLWKH